MNDLQEAQDAKQCRFAVYDAEYMSVKGTGTKKTKICFFYWWVCERFQHQHERVTSSDMSANQLVFDHNASLNASHKNKEQCSNASLQDWYDEGCE